MIITPRHFNQEIQTPGHTIKNLCHEITFYHEFKFVRIPLDFMRERADAASCNIIRDTILEISRKRLMDELCLDKHNLYVFINERMVPRWKNKKINNDLSRKDIFRIFDQIMQKEFVVDIKISLENNEINYKSAPHEPYGTFNREVTIFLREINNIV